MKNLTLFVSCLVLLACYHSEAQSNLDDANFGSFRTQDDPPNQERIKMMQEARDDHSHDGLQNKVWEKQRQEERQQELIDGGYDETDEDLID